MKIGIITIIDNNNYGNRLQNYALIKYIKNTFKVNAITLKNNYLTNNKINYNHNLKIKNKIKIKKIIKKYYLYLVEFPYFKTNKRASKFKKFNDNIIFSKKDIDIYSDLNEYDYLIVGSDQVWNPDHKRLSDLDVLANINNEKRISYAASFGINQLDKKSEMKVINELSKFKCLSVREDVGKEIIEKVTKRNDIEVLIDPTMLLSDLEWNEVLVKPNYLSKIKTEKYILNYFLGDLSEERKKEINRIAKENNCHVINILDKNDPFYTCGPSEFLYLEKNAFLICTDSYHSSVFAIIFNRPFVIFDREEINVKNMSSRLETLISKFKLKNRKYNGEKITEENINHDYSEAYRIIESERNKSRKFLEKALDIEEGSNEN